MNIAAIVIFGLLLIFAKPRHLKDMESLEGKVILVVNGGTVLGESISSFLISKGAKLAMHNNGAKGDIRFPISIRER